MVAPRITAFSPGASPPPVLIAIFQEFSVVNLNSDDGYILDLKQNEALHILDKTVFIIQDYSSASRTLKVIF